MASTGLADHDANRGDHGSRSPTAAPAFSLLIVHPVLKLDANASRGIFWRALQAAYPYPSPPGHPTLAQMPCRLTSWLAWVLWHMVSA